MAALQIPRQSPILVQRLRRLLSSVDLPDAWGLLGPSPRSLLWLARQDRPAELTAEQWDTLLLCWALWDAAGLAPRIVRVARPVAGSVARPSYLLQAPVACPAGR